MEGITDADYAHAKRSCKDFEIKILENIKILIFKTIHYYYLMFFKTSEIFVLKYTSLILKNLFELLD